MGLQEWSTAQGMFPQSLPNLSVDLNYALQNLYGSTEVSAMLLSIGGSGRSAPLLRSLEGYSYRFLPTASTTTDSGHQSTARLLELIIPSESPDCPDVSLRHADGDFHTGDLFQEASQGLYVFRGRDDDWIKSENSLRCDTKYVSTIPSLFLDADFSIIIEPSKTTHWRCVEI